MPEDHTQGLATASSGDTIAQQNASIFASSFDEALTGTRTEQPEPVVEKSSVTTEAKPAAEAKSAEPAPEPEFPVELMTGEKPVAEPVKDELDDIVPSQKMGEQSRANFDKLKQIAREARQEAARVKAELDQAKAVKPAPAVDNEALKAAQERAKELEQRIERADFTQSPKYTGIVAERDQSIADAKAYVEGTDIDPAVIDYASRLTGPKRIAVLREAGMDAETIASIAPHLAHADRKERERTQALENSVTLRAEWEQQTVAQKEAEKARLRAEEDTIYEQTGKSVAEVFEPFQIVPGHDKWNAQVERLKAEAKEFFNGAMPIEKMAEIAYYGVGAKVVHKMNGAMREEIKALKAQLSKLQTAQPAGGGSVNGNAGDTANQAPRNADEMFHQRARAFDMALGIG